MILVKNGLVLIILSAFVAIGCNKDDDDPSEEESIVGTWVGTKLHYKFTPSSIGFGLGDTNDDYDATIEFREDGTVVYRDDGDESTGTYEVKGNQIETSINIADLPFSTTTLRINELTKTELELYFEEEGEYEVPDFGTMDGTFEATFNFERQ
ncbi:MAG TPA: lipocalin family protein [Ohtaekwangia sp.]|nr:lipocalin family protein [Ohtaekwangia sp.]